MCTKIKHDNDMLPMFEAGSVSCRVSGWKDVTQTLPARCTLHRSPSPHSSHHHPPSPPRRSPNILNRQRSPSFKTYNRQNQAD